MYEVFSLDPARVIWTDARLGNLGHNPPGRGDHDDSCCGAKVEQARHLIRPGQWSYVSQVHGSQIALGNQGNLGELGEADAIITQTPAVTISISTADCAPVVLSSKEGIIAGVHAGWRGLQAGIIANTAEKMRALGATEIRGALGPCIHGECYEFGGEELDAFVEKYGVGVRGETSQGKPSLDLPVAIDAECKQHNVELSFVHPSCTSCDESYFSFRARKDNGRQVMLVWLDELK